MSDPTVAHGTFVIDRTYPHPVEKIWAAWSDPAQKAQWFGDGSGEQAQIFEFHPGGRESLSSPSFSFDVLYQDIVPLSRILYTYDMHMDGKKLSVSLAAIEFFAEGKGTRMKLTEYGLFLDGHDNNEQRKKGTMMLTGQLGAYLDRTK